MQVYKALFKVILKNIGQMIIYIAVFISLAAALANTNTDTSGASFTDTKVNIAFINNDTNSKLSEGLESYLGKNCNIVNIPDNTQKLQDALFFRTVSYIVRVPDGFSEDLLAGRPVQLQKTETPGSASAVFLDNLINKYLNTAKVYSESVKNLSQEQLLSYIDKDLSQGTDVRMGSSREAVSVNEKRSYYYNYMAYSLYAVLILGVCSIMMAFNNKDLKKRNLCTPVRLRSMNFQLILGNLTFAVAVWFILILASIIMYGSSMFTTKGLLLLLNSFIFTFAVLSISFLLGNIIKSKGAMSAAANVVALGTSFISGVFVPQALLGSTVLKIASFTPNYWYVKSNNIITGMSNMDMENLAPIFINMLIVIGFAAAVFAVTLVIIKQKRVSS